MKYIYHPILTKNSNYFKIEVPWFSEPGRESLSLLMLFNSYEYKLCLYSYQVLIALGMITLRNI